MSIGGWLERSRLVTEPPLPAPRSPGMDTVTADERLVRWSKAWSPEQIARRLAIDFPNDEEMRVSH
jgi:hypothetical protein